MNLWRESSSYIIKEYFPKSKVSDIKVSDNYKSKLLNATIKEVIVYRDSIACMITQNDVEDYTVRIMGLENGKWLNIGEDFGFELQEIREKFDKKAPRLLQKIQYAEKVKRVSSDTLSFVDYIKNKGVNPTIFLLKKLKKIPLVIYGELHRRKVSWDFLSRVLENNDLTKYVGTIFVELPANQQKEIDKFYASKELQTKILLDVLRMEQIYGWWDKGEYEFLINVWKLNQKLPDDKKIRVVATDEQLAYNQTLTSDDYKKAKDKLIDRNTKMANIIEQYIKTKTDKRNCLFIVGYNHTYKSLVPGSYSSAKGQEPALTAGAQLTQRLSSKNVFTVLQHIPMGTNEGALGLVRQGIFDLAFEKAGNKPVAFDLKNSPFGTEPFDADYELCFDKRIGSFSDNFDGYIFINPLKEECSDYILYEIWNDEFVAEMKRRASISNFNLNGWLGIKEEITKEKIIDLFKEKYEGKKRWKDLWR